MPRSMVPLLGIHTTEMHCICSPNSYAKTPTAGRLRRAWSWKLSKWPLAIEWIIQLWYAASTDGHTSKRWAMHNCSEWRTKSQATCVTKRKKSHGKVWSVNPFTQTMKSTHRLWEANVSWCLPVIPEAGRAAGEQGASGGISCAVALGSMRIRLR